MITIIALTTKTCSLISAGKEYFKERNIAMKEVPPEKRAPPEGSHQF